GYCLHDLNPLPQLPHPRAVADEHRLAIHPRLERSQLARHPSARYGVFDLLHDPLDGLGLVDESVRAEADGLDAALVAARARIHDDRHVDAARLEAPQYFEAVDAGHF